MELKQQRDTATYVSSEETVQHACQIGKTANRFVCVCVSFSIMKLCWSDFLSGILHFVNARPRVSGHDLLNGVIELHIQT